MQQIQLLTSLQLSQIDWNIALPVGEGAVGLLLLILIIALWRRAQANAMRRNAEAEHEAWLAQHQGHPPGLPPAGQFSAGLAQAPSQWIAPADQPSQPWIAPADQPSQPFAIAPQPQPQQPGVAPQPVPQPVVAPPPVVAPRPVAPPPVVAPRPVVPVVLQPKPLPSEDPEDASTVLQAPRDRLPVLDDADFHNDRDEVTVVQSDADRQMLAEIERQALAEAERMAAEERERQEAARNAEREAEQRARALEAAFEADQHARQEAEETERAHQASEQRARQEARQSAQREAALRAASTPAPARGAEGTERARSVRPPSDGDRAQAVASQLAAQARKARERKALADAEQRAIEEAKEIAQAQGAHRAKLQSTELAPSVDELTPVELEPLATGPLKKILLVEDSSTMRRVFQMVLAGEPFSLTTVVCGDEALTTARALGPDLVIADLSLDDRDGYAICRDLRQDPELSGVPVLLLHGSSVEYDPGLADEVQASGAVAKPFESDALLELLRQLMA